MEERMEMSRDVIRQLIRDALSARQFSYVPYSGYAVGAALLCADGSVCSGCNIENAAYGPTNCAERTAIFKAVSQGKREFKAIAVAGGRAGEAPASYAHPCGVCRQVMQEFCGKDFCIITALSEEAYEIHKLGELLPHGFGGENLI